MLRCLAGLERPDRGHIHFADEVWFDARERIERRPQARDIGFLFQEYALFPHLTVAANVAYGLYALPAAERMRRVAEVLERFELSGLDARYPWQISGGQQQRVALARAIVRAGRGCYCSMSRSPPSIRTCVKHSAAGCELLAEFAIPVLIVTHDRMEAIALADQVLVLDDGAVRQTGTIHDVFSTPVSQRVAQLVGVENITVGRVTGVHEGLATVRVGTADLVAVAAADAQGELIVCIRGEEVVLQADANQPSSVQPSCRPGYADRAGRTAGACVARVRLHAHRPDHQVGMQGHGPAPRGKRDSADQASRFI